MNSRSNDDRDDVDVSLLYERYQSQRRRRSHTDPSTAAERIAATTKVALSDRARDAGDAPAEEPEADSTLREVDGIYRDYQQRRQPDYETNIQKVLAAADDVRSERTAERSIVEPSAPSVLKRIFELPGTLLSGAIDKLSTPRQGWLIPAGLTAAAALAVALLISPESQQQRGQELADTLGLGSVETLLDEPAERLASATSAFPAESVQYGFTGGNDEYRRAYRGGQLIMTLVTAARANQRTRAEASLGMIATLYAKPEVETVVASTGQVKSQLDQTPAEQVEVPKRLSKSILTLAGSIGAHHSGEEQSSFHLGVWSRAMRLAVELRIAADSTATHSTYDAYPNLRDAVLANPNLSAEIKSALEKLTPLAIASPPTTAELRAIRQQVETLDAVFAI